MPEDQIDEPTAEWPVLDENTDPTGFAPGINETLGYIESLLKMAGILQAKSL